MLIGIDIIVPKGIVIDLTNKRLTIGQYKGLIATIITFVRP